MIGSIYRIIHLQSNIAYVGSTMDTVRNRWQGHKDKYKHWTQDTNKSCISIYPYMLKYGIESFKCTLVKKYVVSDKTHLRAYEQLWINKFKPINLKCAFNPLFKHQANQTMKKYREANADKIKQWREANSDKIRQRDKRYYQANSDKIKQYREANQDKIKQRKQQMIICECGASFQRCNKSAHEKTSKHLNRMTKPSA